MVEKIRLVKHELEDFHGRINTVFIGGLVDGLDQERPAWIVPILVKVHFAYWWSFALFPRCEGKLKALYIDAQKKSQTQWVLENGLAP